MEATAAVVLVAVKGAATKAVATAVATVAAMEVEMAAAMEVVTVVRMEVWMEAGTAGVREEAGLAQTHDRLCSSMSPRCASHASCP